MSNVICEMLGIKYPIFQGAMAWVSDSSLAAAVSNAGGLGIIAGANAPAEHIRNEIRKAKEIIRNSHPFLSDTTENFRKVNIALPPFLIGLI